MYAVKVAYLLPQISGILRKTCDCSKALNLSASCYNLFFKVGYFSYFA